MQLVTDSALQLLPCRRCSLDWFTFAFSLSFLYDFFLSPSPFNPCGCLRLLYLLENDETRPVLTQPLHHLDEKFFVMISVTFECEGQADCPFLLQVDVAGDGSTTTNIKMNTKWLCNKCRSRPTSAWQVLRAVPQEQARAGCRGLGWVYNNQISKWIPNGYVTHPVLTQPLHHCMTSFTCLSFCIRCWGLELVYNNQYEN
jgi:hypothetical protein